MTGKIKILGARHLIITWKNQKRKVRDKEFGGHHFSSSKSNQF